MLGVVCCPKCKFVTGINLNYKTKKCIKCNYTINLKKIRLISKTENVENMGKLIKDAKKKVEYGNLFVDSK